MKSKFFKPYFLAAALALQLCASVSFAAGAEYYDHTTYPSQGAAGSSSAMRAELDLIEAGFGKLPGLSGNGDKSVFINSGGTAMEAKTAAQARTLLGLAIGTDVQAYDADLAAIAALVSAADKVPYATGAGTWALANFTTAGRALMSDASAAAQLITLGALSNAAGSVGATNLNDQAFNDLTLVTIAPTDHVAIADASDSGKKKKALVSDIVSLVPAASYTTPGIAELATTAEVQAGTDATRVVTPVDLLASVGFTKTFTTNSFALGTPINVAHNLSRSPTEVYALALCTSADGSYSAGDILIVPSYNDGSQRGITIGYNGTNVFASYGVNGVAAVTKGGTSAFVMNTAKWTVVIVARS